MPSPDLLASSISVGAQQEHNGDPFPLVLGRDSRIEDLDQTRQWIADHRQELLQRVERHGTVLFRDFPLATPEDFNSFIAAFGLENFTYEQSFSNAVRVNFSPRVFSANEAPANVTIFLHHEMAQTPIFPSKLFFFCQQPAGEGGATPLCRSDILHQQMQRSHADFLRDCEEKRLKYTNVMPGENDPASGMGRSWQCTLRAENREDAEQRLGEFGYTWEWLPDGCLRATTPTLPAVREASGGRKVFFNQLIAAFRGWKDSRNDPSKAITFGDGTRLDPDTVLEVAELAEELTFDVPWQCGDVALVDNFLVMHGRRTFGGTRKVLASLADAQRHAG